MTGAYYSDERVTLYHGDCLEHPEWWTGADVLVTDPPYGIAWRRGNNDARSSRAHAGIANDENTECRDDALEVWGGGPALVFGSLYVASPPSARHIAVFEKQPDAGVVGSTVGLRRDIEAIYFIGAWPKVAAHRGSVVRTYSRNAGNPSSPAGRTGHPHAKPLDVLEQLLVLCPDGIIADPFAGSGSTLVAARNLGRRAIGVELEERYCEVIAKRLAQDCLDLGSLA